MQTAILEHNFRFRYLLQIQNYGFDNYIHFDWIEKINAFNYFLPEYHGHYTHSCYSQHQNYIHSN